MGCAYVPLDEHSPPDRLAHIINSSGLILLLLKAPYMKSKNIIGHPNIKNILFLGDPQQIQHLQQYSVNFYPTHPEVSECLSLHFTHIRIHRSP